WLNVAMPPGLDSAVGHLFNVRKFAVRADNKKDRTNADSHALGFDVLNEPSHALSFTRTLSWSSRRGNFGAVRSNHDSTHVQVDVIGAEGFRAVHGKLRGGFLSSRSGIIDESPIFS